MYNISLQDMICFNKFVFYFSRVEMGSDIKPFAKTMIHPYVEISRVACQLSEVVR